MWTQLEAYLHLHLVQCVYDTPKERMRHLQGMMVPELCCSIARTVDVSMHKLWLTSVEAKSTNHSVKKLAVVTPTA
jgi:hypothetical protein